MPSKPKLGAKTPDAPEYNSLIVTHDAITAMPRERRYAIVELRTKRVDLDVATGEQQAILELVHIEQPMTAQDETAVVALLDKMFKSRTKLNARPDPTAEADTPLQGLGSELDDGVGDPE